MSTSESEMFAAFAGFTLEGIPALDLGELILGRQPKVALWDHGCTTRTTGKSSSVCVCVCLCVYVYEGRGLLVMDGS